MKDCHCPAKCFCKYDASDLREIGNKILLQSVPVSELLKDAESDRERDLICVVALLDLKIDVRAVMEREGVLSEGCNVLICRENLRNRLFKLLGLPV